MDCLIKSGELEIPETNEVPGDAHQAKLHLTNTLEKHAHIRHLYKLALTLGVDILSAVQKPVSNIRMIFKIWDTFVYLNFIIS